MIYRMFIPAQLAPVLPSDENRRIEKITKTKGQLRAAKPKPSGAARLKRQATKRNNIRKHN